MEEACVTYDWDNILVGDADLNHSEHFFGKSLPIIVCPFGLCPWNLKTCLTILVFQTEMRRDAVLQINNDKENFANVINKNQTMCTKDLIHFAEKSKKTTQELENQKLDQIEEDLKNLRQLMSKAKVSSTIPAAPTTNAKKPSKSTTNLKSSNKSAKPSSASVPNVVPSAQPKSLPTKETNSSTSSVASNPPAKQSKPSSSCPVAKPPNAYNYVEIYRAKNTRAEQRRREQEQEARVFRPRPLPDFKRSHRLLDSKLADLQKHPVCPETPPTLKRSIEAAARRQIIVSYIALFVFGGMVFGLNGAL